MTNCAKPAYLSVSLTYRKRGGPIFEWRQTEEPVGDIVVKGDTAMRMLRMLNIYHHKQSDPEWFDCREPNCHSAAMYVAGLIGPDWSLNPWLLQIYTKVR